MIYICLVKVNNDYDVYYVRTDFIFSGKLTANLEIYSWINFLHMNT